MSGTTEVFWTSDLHFGHKNLLSFCRDTRLGETIDEMDELLIEHWNKKIRRGDLVRILGDVSFHKETKTIEILKRLNGAKHFIRGNHDHVLDKIIKTNPELFQSYKQYDEVKIGSDRFVMCHFPIESFNRMHYGSFMIHGHTHGNTSNSGVPIRKNRVDCGIDNRPQKDMNVFSHDEVLQLIKEQNEKLEEK